MHDLFFNLIVVAKAQAITQVPYTSGGLVAIIMRVVNWGFVLGGGTAVIFIIYAGFEYMTAAGDESKTEEARKTIYHAIIGITIVALSFTLLNWLTIALDLTHAINF